MSIHALALSTEHTFSKQSSQSLTLLPDLGVEGDCHCGVTVQHRSRLKIRPPPKNLRQVHLIDLEILESLNIKPGELGENVTTKGLGLLGLGTGTRLHFLPPAALGATENGAGTIAGSNTETNGVPASQEASIHPVLVVTGLRNPCPQISHFRTGLQEHFIDRDEERKIIARKAGIMSTVEVGGTVEVGMRIVVEPPTQWKALECV
ncbi:hypothetical protein H2200_008405 [Cladophialophora chaetospira]|uniref:MOSC domain-containing protein n=1 Tax=Cladophialophora chaetospira TaxID=386627 RepID=A0AA39CGE1_9EURO|nr:hypothetical protein H2200_008405 [Cladophialophora chaetospira]